MTKVISYSSDNESRSTESIKESAAKEQVWSLIAEFFNWLGDLRNSKIIALLLFFTAFVILLVYVFTGKERSKKLESYKNIPFLDDDEDEQKSSTTVKKDE